MQRGILGVGAVTVAALLATTIGSPAQSAPPPSTPSAGQAITLVTGDVVRVRTDREGRRTATVEPGEGRERVPFIHRSRGDQLSILPADAAPLVASGKLDARLFDITGLLRDGYGDATRTTLPLIVRYRGQRATTLDGTTVSRPLTSIGGAALTARKDRADDFWADRADADKIWLDGKVKAHLDQSVQQIGAPAMWAKGLTGRGISVGVLDTGIDETHPDLAGSVVASKDFSSSESGVVDKAGHGTHVASIITGDGTASDGKYKGVAPDAKLVIGKVLDDSGQGQFSWLIAGMEWVSQHAKVVNMSVGGGIPSDGTDPVSLALDEISERTGTLFVVAAGNNGFDEFGAHDESVTIPGVAEAALTVGAIDREGAVADFSSKGPRVGDGAIKPDLTAPGVDIAAARAADTQIGELVGEHYVRASGTSMASPHVAGAAAILAQQHPAWSGPRLKAALVNTAVPNANDPVFHQGAGLVNVPQAGDTTISASPGSVSALLSDAATTRTVTFRNDGSAAVNLALTLTTAAPTGAFGLDKSSVAVPANGTAEVAVRLDPTKTELGRFGARLEARTADGVGVGVPIGLVREPKLHTISVAGIDRAGKPTGTSIENLHWVDVIDLETGEYVPIHVSQGKIKARVPAGRYTVQVYVDTLQADGTYADATYLSYPTVSVNGDVSLVADARRAERVSATTVDSPKAEKFGFDLIGTTEKIGEHQVISGTGSDDPSVGLYALPTERVRGRSYAFYYRTIRAEPLGARAAPKAYHLALLTNGRIPEQPTYRVYDRRLAALETSYHYNSGDVEGSRFTVVGLAGEGFPSGGGSYPIALPGKRLELYSVVGKPGEQPMMRWMDAPDFTENAMDPPLRAGRRSSFAFNAGAIGPVVDAFGPKCGVGSGHMFLVTYPMAPANALWQLPGDTTRVTLHQNGELIGEADDVASCFPMPATEERYAFHAVTTREPGTRHGLREEATWTFPYALADDTAPPLVTMRVSGAFDLRNTAPAGKPFRLELVADDARIIKTGGLPWLSTVTLQLSYDDGATWTSAKVRSAGKNRWTADVRHPSSGGFVSVRVKAHDRSGTGVDQTVIRAYALR
ncbi:S8 family peptidase [Tenggerimyces flavus]|uniref:S8 family peptidase n=1 Tax=Tenggerimyces flavus TaxID=1708749 RepID=A0ABV7YPT6_9ACTN|nr:S8 family peptidase [Tenggerimyces flavus]MBM7784444.1 subtilisin family serine protease [Tenggerimyces flavus]